MHKWIFFHQKGGGGCCEKCVSIPTSQIWLLKVEQPKISGKDRKEGGVRETNMLWFYGFC